MPAALEGLREQYLPECTFRGRQNKKFQYVGWPRRPSMAGPNRICWMRSLVETDDFWQYGLFAAVGYIRAAASRAGVPVRQACQDLAGRAGHHPAQ